MNNKIHLKTKIAFILFTTYIVLIFVIALFPNSPQIASSSDLISNIRHILAFVVFILLTRITFPKLKWYWLVLIGLGFGLSIELLQLWLTGGTREFSVLDLCYDVVGIAVGMVIIGLRTKEEGQKSN